MSRPKKTNLPPKELPADLMEALEQGVRDVLADPNATSSMRLQAVQAGVKLAQFKHKIKGADSGESMFD